MRAQVSILLASYNGIKFLREQLESIRSQTLRVSTITIRDDGSTDGTVSLLQEWAAGRADVRFLSGPRLGVTNNFFELLANSDEDSQYIAFSDQDDFWQPNKIENAVSILKRHGDDQPLMYCSRLEYVDERLDHLGFSRIPKRLDFANALVENVATGCTIVLNRQARDLILQALPKYALLHDWWCYLVLSALGTVVFDDSATVKYRQHANNQVGRHASRMKYVRHRMARLLRREVSSKLLIDQAAEFKRCFGSHLGSRNKEMLERFLSVRDGFWTRASYAASMEVRRQSWIDTTILRATILVGSV
jgi:glycosyltransferase involved in cell wall biosynthesis